ncbi:uncharacterized protein [Nicotiana tomentosiformis]|uniref:uncharacterized protein n=1 Tax=Nicotiana tomentosiformis TaxID=4098 RepID=UPI00051B0CEB|nr:uncharacterized protein LOC104109949 [Nicotiana tomentosiformis]
MDDDINHCRVLDAIAKDARELPVVELLEYMRTLHEGLMKSYRIQRMRASIDYIHTVIDGVNRFIVCLQNKRCSCGQFQLDELPCPHALAALRHMNESFENYYSPYYTKESLLQTYEIPIDLLPDESKWNVPQHIAEEVVMPPTGKRQTGRPQKQRYKPYN